MRALRYSINITLDGCCDHQSVSPDEETHRYSTGIIEQADGLIFGRKIFEMMESAWRGPAESGHRAEWMTEWMMPFAQTIHKAKKYVVSDSLQTVSWNAELVRGNQLESTVRKLKQQHGKGLYVGGVQLPLALAKLGLIDEYEFIVHPEVAGHGPTLFAGLPNHLKLQYTGRHQFRSGVVALRYKQV